MTEEEVIAEALALYVNWHEALARVAITNAEADSAREHIIKAHTAQNSLKKLQNA